MKDWHFYDKVYRRWIMLTIGPVEEFRAQLERDGFKDMDSIIFCNGLCVELNDENNTGNQRYTIIWMPEWNTATFVHELSHLVMMCFDQVLVPISRDNTEAFAFYIEFWFTEISKARRRHPEGRGPALAKKTF